MPSLLPEPVLAALSGLAACVSLVSCSGSSAGSQPSSVGGAESALSSSAGSANGGIAGAAGSATGAGASVASAAGSPTIAGAAGANSASGGASFNPYGAKPQVVVIGDSVTSIAVGYCGFMHDGGELDQQAELLNPTSLQPDDTPDTNAQTSANTLAHLDRWLAGTHPALIQLNTGLWEVKNLADAERAQTLETYRQNLILIFEHLKASYPDAKLVWASSTPVSADNTKRKNADIEAFNAAAAEIARAHDMPVDDLYAFSVDQHLGWVDGTHFDEPSRKAQMHHVAETLLPLLGLK